MKKTAKKVTKKKSKITVTVTKITMALQPSGLQFQGQLHNGSAGSMLDVMTVRMLEALRTHVNSVLRSKKKEVKK